MGVSESQILQLNSQSEDNTEFLKHRYLNTIEAMIQIIDYTETQLVDISQEWLTYFNLCKSTFLNNKPYLTTPAVIDFNQCNLDFKNLYTQLQTLKNTSNVPFKNLDISITTIYSLVLTPHLCNRFRLRY